jgi:hypothetical protein
MDIGLMIVLGRLLLDSNAVNGGVTPTTTGWEALTQPVILTPEQIALPTSTAEVPNCRFNEKLTYIASQDKYVCLPDLK